MLSFEYLLIPLCKAIFIFHTTFSSPFCVTFSRIFVIFAE